MLQQKPAIRTKWRQQRSR